MSCAGKTEEEQKPSEEKEEGAGNVSFDALLILSNQGLPFIVCLCLLSSQGLPFIVCMSFIQSGPAFHCLSVFYPTRACLSLFVSVFYPTRACLSLFVSVFCPTRACLSLFVSVIKKVPVLGLLSVFDVISMSGYMNVWLFSLSYCLYPPPFLLSYVSLSWLNDVWWPEAFHYS